MADARRLKEERIATGDLLTTSKDLSECRAALRSAIETVNVPLVAAQSFTFLSNAGDNQKAFNHWVPLLNSLRSNCFRRASEKVENAISKMKRLKANLRQFEQYAADVARRLGKTPIVMTSEKAGPFGIKRTVNTMILEEKSELAKAFGVSAAIELNIQRCEAIKGRLKQLEDAFPNKRIYDRSQSRPIAFTIAAEVAPLNNILLAAFNAAGTVENSINHMATLEMHAMAQEQALKGV